MSSLWTPGGEHPVEPQGQDEPDVPAQAPGPPPDDADPLAGLSPEERERAEEMAAQMADVRQQLAEAPPETVVANHAMGLYELGAIHLSSEPPNIEAAQLPIDAMAAMVEGLEGRLGEVEPTLKDALSQLQMAFVQVKQQVEQGQSPTGD